MADPETAEMYIERPVQEGQMPKYVCIRGTSQLEGYFAHLRSIYVCWQQLLTSSGHDSDGNIQLQASGVSVHACE